MPNKYPALAIEGGLERRGVGMFDQMNGGGAHEVIIETNQHVLDISDLSEREISGVLLAYQLRSQDLRKDQRFRYVVIFKNCGDGAGASLEHTHSQLIATPARPKRTREELAECAKHSQAKDCCLVCDILDQDLDSKTHIIQESPGFLALAPFASCFPCETWIIPKRHHPDHDQITESERHDLAMVLKDTLTRINRAMNNAPYNYLIHTAPNRLPRPGYWHTLDKDYHWHLEVIPRLTNIAGLEWGTGFYINPTPPEDAAAYLRNLD